MEPDLASQEPVSSAAPSAGAPFNGTLEDNTPAGVLQMLSSQGETGAVRFTGDSGCTVYLHNGELYFAETAETGEDLAVALVRPGRLSADEWDQSTATGYPTETVGEVLIETESITREMLASIVLSVIYDPLIQLFRSPEGDFEFEPGIVHWIGPYRTFGVDAIVAEVRRRTREADEMAPVIPSLDAWVKTARALPEDHGNVSLRRDDWEVVVSAATGRTVRELAVDLGRGRWSTARLVYRLASVNLVEVDADYAPDTDADFAPSSTSQAPAVDTSTSFDANAIFDSSTTFDAPSGFDQGDLEDAGSVADDPQTRSLSDGPPPLDLADFAPAETESGQDAGSGDTWTDATWEPAGWDAPTTDDAGGAFSAPADTSTDWATPAAEPGSAWDAVETTDAPSTGWEGTEGALSETSWAPEGGPAWDADPVGGTEEPPAWDAPTPLHEVADADEPAGFDASSLHPDIAKALAESTYADSATAINAMAARLGASDDDDDDDWEAAADGSADEASAFWASGVDEDSSAWTGQSDGDSSDFTWEPAVWDTGVEATPLPQREHVPADPDAPPPPGASDPQWLENLYSQFMPTGDGQPGARGEAATQDPSFGKDPGAAPKAKTLRRLMSAIKRL